MRNPVFGQVASAALVICATAWSHAEEFDEFDPIIEINSTDGDIGFHVLLDGEGWHLGKMFDADGDRMLRTKGTNPAPLTIDKLRGRVNHQISTKLYGLLQVRGRKAIVNA